MRNDGPSTLFQSLSDEALKERYASGELAPKIGITRHAAE